MVALPIVKNHSSIELSPIKAIELEASKRKGVVSLAQGIPSFATPQVITDGVKERILSHQCDKYSLTTGLQELREEIAYSLAKEGLEYDPDTEIVVTAGSIEAVSATLLALTKPGDEVIIPSPTYTSYQNAIKMARCIPRFAPLNEDDNFDLDTSEIEKLISKRTRAIFYCSPNNPTGTIFSKEKSLELLEIALTHRLFIITDEVYKDFYYVDTPHFTPASIPDAKGCVIRICSFSKAFAMTGWRVGFVHSSKELMGKILAVHDTLVTCAPVVSQYAAIEALRNSEEIISQFRLEYLKRRNFMLAALDGMSHIFDYQSPMASYFVFPRVKDTVKYSHDSRRLAFDILDKANVALVPGIAFGPTGESHLRMSFGREMKDIEIAMDRLSAYFEKSAKQAKPSSFTPKSGQRESLSAVSSILLRKATQYMLAFAAKLYLKITKPVILGIAGIKGKTLVKRMLKEKLSKSYTVRANPLSFNTQIGLSLSILDLNPPSKLIQKFLFPLQILWRLLLPKPSVDLLILEYGIRKEKDALELLNIAIPKWLIITPLTTSDTSLDIGEIASGIQALASNVPAHHIICSEENRDILQIGSAALFNIGIKNIEPRSGRIESSFLFAKQVTEVITEALKEKI